MKGPLVAALAAGSLVAVAFGGIAMAAEGEDLSVPSAVVTATDAPDASGEETSDDDVSSPDADDDADSAEESHGLVCVLIPVETVDEAAAPQEPTSADETPSIDELLAANDIECSGTGNERSAEVALVPRYLAHSDAYSGAEKGLAISSWAKSKSQKHSDDDSEPTLPADDAPGEGAPEGADPAPTESEAPASPGRSGESHGNSGSNGNGGRGRGH